MKIGYARVSTKEQSLDIQVKALKRAGCKLIYQEKVSGVGRDRPEFQKMMEQIRKGDVLVIWRLDRLARSTRLLLDTIEQLKEKGASFKSLSESWADTTSATGKLVMTFFAGLAEFERDLIRDRTDVGRRAAIERGVRFGRPTKMTADQLKLARKLLKQGESIRHVADIFGVHFTTLYRYLRGGKC
ncbi:MAG: recombinase family protein [Candidatus Obscuribacterales bacterium]|nr:recombinase family protein [Candidatus Obscuribacterales bacterium]